ncbi:MAG: hypothetical protein ACM3PX_02145, partial [Omnitrophica WOR_2 bacterium]
ILIPGMLSAQKEMGKLDVSDWALFSIGYNKQIKKINDSTLYAYYRAGADKSGIMIFDRSMNIIRDIPLDLTKSKKVIFTMKAYAEFIAFPYTFYRPDIRAVVIVGYAKNDRKDYSIVGITYSIDGAGLLDVQEFANTSSDNFLIKYSKNEEYFLVAELIKKQKGKGHKVKYDVFNKECQKIYSAEGDLLRDGDIYFKLLDNGELVHYSIKEEGRKITYLFTRFDKQGNKATAVFAPPKTDIYNYDGFDIIKSDNGEYFASCMKFRPKAKGFAILKIDFEKKIVKKITDKNFDKAGLAKLNSVRSKSVSMVGNKVKPVKKIDTYSIYSTSTDEDNIYVVLQDFYVRMKTDKSGTTYKYGSAGLIISCYSKNGDEKWTTPIKRIAKQVEGDMNIFNGNGQSIALSSYETSDDICLLVRSQDKTYYTRIDKATGQDIEPVLVLSDEKAYTNANCLGWFDEDGVVVLSMKGLSIFKKNDFWLRSLKMDISN